jgi:hypothetical protein
MAPSQRALSSQSSSGRIFNETPYKRRLIPLKSLESPKSFPAKTASGNNHNEHFYSNLRWRFP